MAHRRLEEAPFLIDITDNEIKDYEIDGVVCLRGLFDQRWLQNLAVGVEKNFSDPGPDSMNYTPQGEPGRFYDDYCNWQRIDEYRDFISESPAAEIAGRLMQSASVRIYHEHVLVKEPGTQQVTPWHHDQPYYGVDGDQLCSLWLPLDPVPKYACPEFVAGSHSDGRLYTPRLFIDHSSYADNAPGFDDVPDIDKQRDSHRILCWDLSPGDCIVFQMRVLHGAPATLGLTTRRRGFSTRWLGDDARFAERPWLTSPPYHELDLAPGEPMHHNLFPLMWSEPGST